MPDRTLLENVQRLFNKCTKECNPSLLLDKFTRPCKSEEQKDEIKKVIDSSSQDLKEQFDQATKQRSDFLKSFKAQCWNRITTSPLALHLSRSTPLENAGLCLHRIYGFPYIPGSALKGMAHSYAVTIWLSTEAAGKNDIEKMRIWERIIKVFGSAPSPWFDNPKPKDGPVLVQKAEKILGIQLLPDNPEERKNKIKEWNRSGSVIFHDAWPSQLPQIIVDIVNNHHPDYYSEKSDEGPGDWENPNPVYFPAFSTGVEFEFALSHRSLIATDSNESLDLARLWLDGALTYLGAGAKTNSGYGAFKTIESQPSVLPDTAPLKIFETTLTLVTPAFLAGANPKKEEDCDLRPATLRGLLRWWWRTLHSGYLDVKTLRRLESAIWGDTNTGGAIRVEIEPIVVNKELFDKKANRNLERPKNNETTQGLSYMSFGMDDKRDVDGRKERCQRYYIKSGSQWTIRLFARKGKVSISFDMDISKEMILQQAQSALWLLSHFGGIGSKARKGFGSFADPGNLSLNVEKIKELATELRSQCNLNNSFKEQNAFSCSLEQTDQLMYEIPTPWTDPWRALDKLGYAYQSFAQIKKHDLSKQALGLPRRIKQPQKGEFRPTGPVKKLIDENRNNPSKQVRHSSPVHFHISHGANNQLTIRIMAFPAKYLPNIDQSKKMLKELINHLKRELE
jgi:CRISPR-associated protein Cmr6